MLKGTMNNKNKNKMISYFHLFQIWFDSYSKHESMIRKIRIK